MDLIDLLGFAGAATVLTAYALTSARSVRVPPTLLAVLNLGSGALVVNGLVHQAWPSIVVNTIWFTVAVVALVRGARSGEQAGRPVAAATSCRSPRAR